MTDRQGTPGQWDQAAREMERFRRDSLVKILNKRLQGLEEVNASLKVTIAVLREQLERCQAHNTALGEVLRCYGIVSSVTAPIAPPEPGRQWVPPEPAPRKRWWERALDALARVPPDPM